MNNVQYHYETASLSAAETGPGKRIVEGILRFLTDMSRRAALRAEFMELERKNSLDPMLHDIGLTRPELLTMIGGYPASGWMLPKMAERVGIDLEHVGIGTRQALSRECALCHTRRACKRWLKNADADAGAYRNFCPNAPVFDTMLAERQEAHAVLH